MILMEIQFTNDEQLIELKMQDVIIPLESAEYLVNVSKYIDFELQKFFGKQPFYNLKNTQDLLGHLVIGLAPTYLRRNYWTTNWLYKNPRVFC